MPLKCAERRFRWLKNNMEKNKRLLKIGFLLVVLFAVALAFLRTASYHAASGRQARAVQEAATERQLVENLKDEEILGIPPQPSTAGEPLTKEEKRAQAVQRYTHRPDLGVSGQGYSFHPAPNTAPHAYQALPSVSTGAQFNPGSYRPQGLSAANYGQYGSGAGYPEGGNPSAQNVPAQPGVYRPTVQEQIQAERERAFSPFLTGMNRKRQEQLQNQLKGLSSNIDRALAKALLPQNKKNANIEKYLQRNASASAVSSGPFAPVMEQVASQKAGVVNSMGQAFGQEAAQEAGKVMDDFQSEMASAVNSPNMSSQQIAEKVKQVAQKYEQKLQKMSNDNSFKKFQQERIEKDNLLKEEISKQYGPEIATQANKAIDEAREKDMKLAMQGLPAEEYYKQQMANQRDRRKALEEIITKSGKSTKGLFAAEDNVERQEVQQRLQDEEEGKILGRSYRTGETELKAIDQSLKQERDEKLKTAGEVYGEKGARRIDAIYQKYYNDYMKIWQNPETSKTDKQQATMELRQGVNKELDQLQNDPQLKEARISRQVDSSLSQIMQDPNVQKASAEQKAALEQHARTVLREMYEQANQVMSSDLPEAEKQKQLQQIQATAQRKLAGQE